MISIKTKSLSALSLLLIFLSASIHADKEPKAKVGDVTFDGLTIVKLSRHTETQLKEGIDWSTYSSYQLAPSDVSFRKNWQRDYNSNRMSLDTRVTDKDMERIKKGVAQIMDEKFDEALANDAKLTKANEADANTLLFKVTVLNLDVTAPDVQSASNSKNYVRSAGSALLVLEVHDALSGDLLARWADAREDPETGYAQWANRVSNTSAVKQIASNWTKRMVEGIEELKAGKMPK